MSRRRAQTPPAECPVCGADVPPRASACPECGADERSGWNEDDTRYDGADIPESAFEDESDSSSRKRAPRAGVHPLWLVVGALILLVLIARALALF